MRVSRDQAAENRQNVIDVASRLFRERGFDGIGIKDLMAGAGMTQGAFYKQFQSKEDLAAQASKRALEDAVNRWSRAITENPDDPIGVISAIVEFYLSPEHLGEKMNGCPMVALGADAARQGSDVKASFESGINVHLDILENLIAETGDEKPRDTAMAILSMMIGAMTLSRAVNDTGLAKNILTANAAQIHKIFLFEKSGTPPAAQDDLPGS
ncbi:TetR/AcrR family transcriptional regulator [Rhodospirillaceae bacterium KN72]|uniref:TetR/AcrR family transcriptional regulator n=1 Tax=Pacificispira spongiicola TaxID=2729598 RepID=A0A7Y0E3C2_9PROT|nr:TetR/AcrR family transcriptional regulator [Pacificispira spongiicola]NMM46474.1 TetR/AcrR family transcriptional regulator [Pacificispira spongiicola]